MTTKYGKLFAETARTTTGDHNVSEKLMHKLAIQAPPKLLVEKYLVEIASIYKIDYEPDPQVMKEEEQNSKFYLDPIHSLDIDFNFFLLLFFRRRSAH